MGGPVDSVRSLATCIREKQQAVFEAWRDRIVDDPEVPTDRVGPLELADHVPELIARIVSALDEFATWRDDAEARGELAGRGPAAAKHVRMRIREGYDLAQVLRELHQLREAIMEVCERELVHMGGDGARLVHGAIDAAMMIAALDSRKHLGSS